MEKYFIVNKSFEYIPTYYQRVAINNGKDVARVVTKERNINRARSCHHVFMKESMGIMKNIVYTLT